MRITLQCALAAVLACFFASNSNATLTLVDTYKTGGESTDNIVSLAGEKLGISGLESLLRLDNLARPSLGSPFSVSYTQVDTSKGGNPNNGATISWNPTVTLLGIYVFGGSQGANLYRVIDGNSGSVTTPLTGNSGKYATISHIVLLGTPRQSVPEAGATLSLLILAIGSLGVAPTQIRRAVIEARSDLRVNS
jgi:hypothetical protein